ncbi:MAG TPA: excinuclease ABC subunit UvrC [Syntrophomonadaceae bacterium]|nr:excinuclease ABC subunit UvrC [Syntrophomonadaceae bacterium]
MKERLKTVPMQPGVYLYKDSDGRVIYVGKAKLLRNRMRSYFQASHTLHPKVRAMMNRVAEFDFIVTASEMEALLLENNLIKAYQPRYNIDLRDDKTYPYLKITIAEEFPRILVVREDKDGRSRYFGPYTEAGALRETVRVLTNIFPLRTCKNLVRRERPCLNRDLGRCLAPCTGCVDQVDYRQMVDEIVSFMEGNYQDLLTSKQSEMQEAAADLEFEKAARLRDQIESIRKLGQKQKVDLEHPYDMDLVAILAEEKAALGLLFKIRAGKLISKDSFWLTRAMEEPEPDLMEFLFKRYYDNQDDVPPEILVNILPSSHLLIGDWLRGNNGRKVAIKVPVKGEKRRLMDMVENNARVLLQERFTGEQARERILVHLSQVLDLEIIPQRIECYDVSHLAGQETVASMVVFTGGLADKKAYRRFKIMVEKNNDYDALAETLQRRLLEARQGNPNFLPEPDLLVIDGGVGQLHAVLAVLDKMGMEIPTISLAKKREEIYRPGQAEPLLLPRRDEGLKLLQRLRDEAHRFAISYNRQRRNKKLTSSLLDQIPGVGAKRKKVLLQHFGSVAALRQASPQEITAVSGISTRLAQEICDYFGKEKD